MLESIWNYLHRNEKMNESAVRKSLVQFLHFRVLPKACDEQVGLGKPCISLRPYSDFCRKHVFRLDSVQILAELPRLLREAPFLLWTLSRVPERGGKTSQPDTEPIRGRQVQATQSSEEISRTADKPPHHGYP